MFKKTIFVIFLLFPVLGYSQKSKPNSALKELDECIAKRSDFEIAKKNRIQKLEKEFSKKNKTLTYQYKLCVDLYNEYRSYKYDSAYSLAGQMLSTAEKLKDPNRIADSKIALAFSCLSAGLYKEATEISGSIDSTQLQLNTKANLYSFLSTLNINMADFSPEPYYSKYRLNSLMYCNKYIALSKIMIPELIMVKIRKCQLTNNYGKATKTAEKYLSTKNLGPHDYAIVASTLGYFYQRSCLKSKNSCKNAIIYLII